MKLRQAQLQEQQEQARERKERNRARGRVQSILGQLRREGAVLSSEQRQELVEELVLAAEGAGNILSPAEMHKVNEYAERLVVPVGEPDAPNVTASSTQPPVPELAPEKPDADVDAAALSAHLVPTAAAVRGALKKAARERTSTSWSRLEQQLGSALPPLSNEERVQALVHIDRSGAGDEPLLSSLIAAGDPHFAHQYYRRVLAALGLDAPDDDEDLREVVEADAEQAFADWRPR